MADPVAEKQGDVLLPEFLQRFHRVLGEETLQGAEVLQTARQGAGRIAVCLQILGVVCDLSLEIHADLPDSTFRPLAAAFQQLLDTLET